ncbi:Beta-lactamase [Streptomyces venezuelae]|uniref:serine hydrolase domain-containing protein n=1 Tax=Streptomyces gardneri TaxID=66892 RepID=UPI0006BCBEEF|nr:serine hydrolase domain-containing protein [Streptomyces gardneri]ALO11335.1 Beta-lactamase [Streptomyces venezuelae]QPK48251.1 beta-lactamase family protein [Streptomyces gardneri]WRK39711.1 serine hydrolase domain-containing protein [Streptomyces venezuelae]CUM38143.1 D-alanyl-D-alanine carboxypeptidase [Streptomyces venezuelae]
MRKSTRTMLAAALALGVAAGPAIVPATAATPPAATATAAVPAPLPSLETTMPGAIAGLPRADATAALVRVGGTGGSWQGSSGVHDLESGSPADPAARFRAGSVTKVFTAATVLQLAAEGRIDLDRPARSYLPDLIPGRYAKVTVRQLLNHTHGVPAPDFPGETVEEWYANRFVVHSPEAMVRSATAKPREFRPGTRQHYLNIGYTIAGLLVERVTGDTYERQVERRILRPLGLRDTYFPGEAAEITGPYNHGYQTMRLDDGTTGLRDVSVWGTTDGWAAGDIVSTTAELERFTRALFKGGVVRGPLLEEMFTLPKVPDLKSGDPAAYSAGLSMKRLGGREVWGKTGGRWGYNSAIASTRDGARTLVYSVNSTDAKGQDMNRTALTLMVSAYGLPE